MNTTPPRLELATPPRVFLAGTIQGPKTSKPTFVKGGATSVLSVTSYSVTSNEPVPGLSDSPMGYLASLVVDLTVIVTHYQISDMVAFW